MAMAGVGVGAAAAAVATAPCADDDALLCRSMQICAGEQWTVTNAQYFRWGHARLLLSVAGLSCVVGWAQRCGPEKRVEI